MSSSKYQVPTKLFKRLGAESAETAASSASSMSSSSSNLLSSSPTGFSGMPPSSPRNKGSVIIMSPRSILTKSRLGFSSFSSPRSQRISTLAGGGATSTVLSTIPRILQDSVDYLRDADRDKTEGLFRIPGDSENVNKLILMYDALEKKQQQCLQGTVESSDSDEEEDKDFHMNLLEKYSPTAHDVATLMKRYLMKLAQPLIDEQTKKDMIAIYARGKREGKDKQLIAYEVVIRALDIVEQDRLCLAFILRFLLLVAGSAVDHESGEVTGNKMTVENLARVFAPIIMRDDETAIAAATGQQQTLSMNAMEQMKQIDQIIVVTEILIWNAMELLVSPSAAASAAASSKE